MPATQPVCAVLMAVVSTASADVSVEYAVCCLLLGDSEIAEDALCLGPTSTAEQADPSIKSFVLVSHHRHSSLDLLSGCLQGALCSGHSSKASDW